jgi:hypothetical protein
MWDMREKVCLALVKPSEQNAACMAKSHARRVPRQGALRTYSHAMRVIRVKVMSVPATQSGLVGSAL